MMTGPSSPRLIQLQPQADLATPPPARQFSHSRSASASSKPRPGSAPITRTSSLRSKTKGINLNLAVSPVSAGPSPSSFSNGHKRSSSVLTHNQFASQHSLPQLPENTPSSLGPPSSPLPSATEELKYDIPLPPMEHISSLDIDDQLRFLALKEMSVVEIKDSIHNLNEKLSRSERDLHKLREVIQKSLYRELNGQGNASANGPGKSRNRQTSNPRDEAIASTRLGSRRRTLSSSSPGGLFHSSNGTDEVSLDSAPSSSSETTTAADKSHALQMNHQLDPKSSKRQSLLWSNLSKPLNLIQQFDNILTQEFERSLMPGAQASPTNQKVMSPDHSTAQQQPQQQPFHTRKLSLNSNSTESGKRYSQDSLSSASISSIPSPLKTKSDSKSAKSNIDLDQYFPPASDPVIAEPLKTTYNGKRSSEDMFQTVSSSIWSFVNDVKTNVLSSLGEEDTISPNRPGGRTSQLNQSNRYHRQTTPPTSNEPMYNLETGSTISLDDVSSGRPDTNTTMKQDDLADTSFDIDADNDEQVDLSIYSQMRRSGSLKRR